jgi:two-component system CheB/CheR fusion protein
MSERDNADSVPPEASELRHEAERRLRDKEALPRMAEVDARPLMHELQVHQIELEMQNEELLRAQATAQEASEKYGDLFDFAPIGYFLWDCLGRIVEVNLAGASLLGLDRNTVIHKRFGQFVVLEDRPAFADFCTQVLATGTKQTCNIKLLSTGQPVYVLIESIATQNRQEQGELCRAAVLDITRQKQAEKELGAAKDAAELARDAADRANRTKDHFLAVLSHELRTPLTPVVMGLSMLQDRPDLDPAVRETLEMVRRNVELEVLLIDDLLDVSRIARGKIELSRSTVELHTVIHNAVEVCKPDIEARRLDFGVDMGPDSPYWIEADVHRLQQVFWNLLRNAIKFTPHGGCVGIRCRRDGTHVIIEVNDSGMGIEPESLSRVFDAFEQVERSITRQFGGLGLGLAISKALVEMHAGTISAHSQGRDKGATFRVRLPLTVPVVQREAPTPNIGPKKCAVRPLRILLVEDHGVTAKMIRMVLASQGHEIETAGDVATGLELADKERFDLLISDLGLPDASGYDLIRGIREQGQRFPAIAMSGYGQETDIQRSHEAGFAVHLIKPASREALIEAIASVVLPPGTDERQPKSPTK